MTDNTNQMKPSQEQVWKKYYSEGFQEILDQPLPEGTIWSGLIEPALHTTGATNDAFVYFGNHISRPKLIEEVDTCARMLKGMGLKEGDEIMLFAPLMPESMYLVFAADKTGITIIMPNLSASHESLGHSMDKSRVAFVFDGMEPMLSDILARTQFEHVVLLSVTRSMAVPLSWMLGAANWLKTKKVRNRSTKYITYDNAIKRYGSYNGNIVAPRRDDHVAMIFASGGTTAKGTAKQIGVGDKAMLSMFRSALAFNLTNNPFCENTRSFSLVPPFVCTGLFALVLAPLYRGMTVYLDPRLDQKHFNEGMFKIRPQITLVSGCLWAGFFREVEKRNKAGKKVDLSYFTLPIMGGEGCIPETLTWMDELAYANGASVGIVSGYGMSETFSVMTVDHRPGVRKDHSVKRAISVGYPFPGFTVGIFDDEGNELPYGQCGELRCKTSTMMTCYLNNPELTQQVIGDGWIHSGDMAEMSPDGLVYLYGRKHEHVVSPSGERVYLFDIANTMRQDRDVRDSLVLLAGDHANQHVVAHLILEEHAQANALQVLQRLDEESRTYLPEGIAISGYQIHTGIFKVSFITKTDRGYYGNILTGYCLPRNGELKPVNFDN